MARNIQLTCPGCDKQMELPVTLLGHRGQCHECGRVGIIEKTGNRSPGSATLALPPEPEPTPKPKPVREPTPPPIRKFKKPKTMSQAAPSSPAKRQQPKNENLLSWVIISGASILIVGFLLWAYWSERKVPIVETPPKRPSVETVTPPPEWENPTKLLRLLTESYGDPADRSSALCTAAAALVKAGARDEADMFLEVALVNANKIKDRFEKINRLIEISAIHLSADNRKDAEKTLESAQKTLEESPPEAGAPNTGQNIGDRPEAEDPHFNNAYRQIALQFCRMGNVDKAAKIVVRINGRKFQDGVLLEMVTDLLRQSRNTTGARKVAEQIDNSNKDVRDRALMQIIETNIDKHNFDEARDLVEHLSRKEHIDDKIGDAANEWDRTKNNAETELNKIQNPAQPDENSKDQKLRDFALETYFMFPKLAEEAASALESDEIQSKTWELLTRNMVNFGEYDEALRLAMKIEDNTRRRKSIFDIAVAFSSVQSPYFATPEPLKVEFSVTEKLFAKKLAEAMRKMTVAPSPASKPPD